MSWRFRNEQKIPCTRIYRPIYLKCDVIWCFWMLTHFALERYQIQIGILHRFNVRRDLWYIFHFHLFGKWVYHKTEFDLRLDEQVFRVTVFRYTLVAIFGLKFWCCQNVVRIPAWPVAALVSLSKTLNHNCFVLRMGRKAVGHVCCVMHVKEPRTLIVKEKGLAPVFLDSRLEHPAGWICTCYKSSVSLSLSIPECFSNVHFHSVILCTVCMLCWCCLRLCVFVISGTGYPKLEIFGYPGTINNCVKTQKYLRMYTITNMNKCFSCFIRVTINVDLL